MMAVKRADGNETVTSLRARTWVSPDPYALVAPTECAADAAAVAVGVDPGAAVEKSLIPPRYSLGGSRHARRDGFPPPDVG